MRILTGVVAALSALLPAAAGNGQEDAAPSSPPATVATHYFYWYRHPDEHFPQPGREGHRHHFPEPEAVDYTDPTWHRGEFADMARVGIDVALPVYWGCPDCGDRPHLRFSDAGLPAMVEALDALRAAGEPAPRLGMFYDTSTLAFGGRADLTTAAGRARFTGTVLRFFARVPPRHRALHHGRPLLVLYGAGFAARWDASLGDVLRSAWREHESGPPPFLVADASWAAIGQDATTAWGAALGGPKLFDEPRVAQLGPGYDDTPVPGRRTPIRPREDGAFYRHSWRAAIAHDPELVLIETWNELHEGTGICRSREFGDRYLRLTAAAVARLRRGEPGPPVALEHSEPLPRPDLSWGADAAGREAVSWRPGSAQGLRPIVWEDGPIERGDEHLVATCPEGRPCSYVYLQVSDHYRFDAGGEPFRLTLRGRGLSGLRVEYDSTDRDATLAGAYTPAKRRHAAAGEPARTAVFALPRARFADRQNGGADLRLVLPPGRLELTAVELAPARDDGRR